MGIVNHKLCDTLAYLKQKLNMKKTFTLIAIMALFFSVRAQQLQNGGFENWTGNNPDNWYNIDALTGQFGLTTDLVQQVTINVPIGTYCVKLLNDSVIIPGQGATVLPGILSAGPLSLSQTEGIVWGKLPYAFRPDSLSFLFKYVPTNADTCGFSYSLTKNGVKVAGQDAGYFLLLPSTANFVRITIPWDYVSTDVPDSLSLVFISSLADNSQKGSTLWLEDVKIIGGGGSVGIEDLQIASAVKVYPNPTSDVVKVSVPEKFVGYTLQIVDVQGRIVAVQSINEVLTSVALTELANGQYFVRILSTDNGVIRQDQITVIK